MWLTSWRTSHSVHGVRQVSWPGRTVPSFSPNAPLAAVNQSTIPSKAELTPTSVGPGPAPYWRLSDPGLRRRPGLGARRGNRGTAGRDPAAERPGAVAEQGEGGRDKDAPDDRRVDEH